MWHRGGVNQIVSQGIDDMQSLFLPGSSLHVQEQSSHGTVFPLQKTTHEATVMKISFQRNTEHLSLLLLCYTMGVVAS